MASEAIVGQFHDRKRFHLYGIHSDIESITSSQGPVQNFISFESVKGDEDNAVGAEEHTHQWNACCVLSSGVTRLISFIVYYGVGVLFYHYVESWSPLDCVYFTTVSSKHFMKHLLDDNYLIDFTVTTVGYGDVTPTTDGVYVESLLMLQLMVCIYLAAGRLFAIVYVMVGLVYIMGIFVDAIQNIMDVVFRVLVFRAHLPAQVRFPPTPTFLPCQVFIYIQQTLRSRRILLALCMAVFVVALGAAFICFNEKWSAVEGLYWAVMTTTVSLAIPCRHCRIQVTCMFCMPQSVGYGDRMTQKNSSR